MNAPKIGEEPPITPLNKGDIVAAISDLDPNVLEIIANIVTYNNLHPENRILLDASCIDFLHNCGSFLNDLYKRDPERAHILATGLRECLGSANAIIFGVWCDVERLTATKKDQKKDKQ